MIETKNMEDFVQEQIRSAVDHFVASVISDTDWTQDLEQRIVQHVQDRITARFSNIETVPDLVDTVKTSVRTLMEQGQVPGLGQYIDQALVRRTIDQAVEREIQSSIESIMLDPVWIAKIETLINQSYVTKLSQWISAVDVNTIIKSEIDAGIDRWQDRLKQDFATQGILDSADSRQLTLTPGQVSVTDRLACQNFVTSSRAEIQGVLEVNDLILLGTINTDNRSWNELSNKIAQDTLAYMTDQWRQDLVADVLNTAKTQGIEFQDVVIRGASLVKDGVLNPVVRHSTLETLGNLDRLAVIGNADLSGTVHVRPRRVGINTSDPEMALSIWDEEVVVVTGKLRQNHAFLGTARQQNLSLGVNRKAWLDIDLDGLVSVKNFRIDRHRISFAGQVPGYSGTRGDIVFNSDPTDGQPFAWVCLGAFRWQPLKAAQ
jgi:predicted house-cleaning noncanonical NTP pyrophosphatase (MazG superfamily)